MLFRLILLVLFCTNAYAQNNMAIIKLTPPSFKKDENLKLLLEKRRSWRSFAAKELSLQDTASILWATAGKKFDTVTGATRTAPSAGATYPLELYLVAGKDSVAGLAQGIYHYLIEGHSLELIKQGDFRQKLSEACLGQGFISEAPVSLIISAKIGRTSIRYGNRAKRYVYMEAGSASQNTYLAVTSLNLSTVEVGAFSDSAVKQLLGLDKDTSALIVMPIGYAGHG